MKQALLILSLLLAGCSGGPFEPDLEFCGLTKATSGGGGTSTQSKNMGRVVGACESAIILEDETTL